MEHFVTLFDSKFLPQGLELHKSMERHVPDFVLWIICVDDKAFEALGKLLLPRTRLLQLTKIETTELLSVKSARTIGEYCWTVTPFAPRFVFEAEEAVERVTYIDADLWFRKDPAAIFDEFESSGKSVLITDHAYAPEYDQAATSGQFCVQFMIFKREESEVVRQWWEDRCIEWCYARFEDEKFGDQKYLDDWPTRFASFVHVLRDKELLLAPWNVTRFPIGRAVAFHFHGVLLGRKRIFIPPRYHIPHVLIELVFGPYFRGLKSAIETLRQIGYDYVPQAESIDGLASLFLRFRLLKRFLWPKAIQFKLE